MTGRHARLPGIAPPARAGTRPGPDGRGLARAARPGDHEDRRVHQPGDQARRRGAAARGTAVRRRPGRRPAPCTGTSPEVGVRRRATARGGDRPEGGVQRRVLRQDRRLHVPQRGSRAPRRAPRRAAPARADRRRARRPAGRRGRGRASAGATSPRAAGPPRPAAPAPAARRRAAPAASRASRSPATAPARTSASRRRSVVAKGASGQSAYGSPRHRSTAARSWRLGLGGLTRGEPGVPACGEVPDPERVDGPPVDRQGVARSRGARRTGPVEPFGRSGSSELRSRTTWAWSDLRAETGGSPSQSASARRVGADHAGSARGEDGQEQPLLRSRHWDGGEVVRQDLQRSEDRDAHREKLGRFTPERAIEGGQNPERRRTCQGRSRTGHR